MKYKEAITTRGLIYEVSKETNVDIKTVEIVVDEYMSQIIQAILDDKSVVLRDFGKFTFKNKFNRKYYDINLADVKETTYQASVKFVAHMNLRNYLGKYHGT